MSNVETLALNSNGWYNLNPGHINLDKTIGLKEITIEGDDILYIDMNQDGVYQTADDMSVNIETNDS